MHGGIRVGVQLTPQFTKGLSRPTYRIGVPAMRTGNHRKTIRQILPPLSSVTYSAPSGPTASPLGLARDARNGNVLADSASAKDSGIPNVPSLWRGTNITE